MPNGPTSGRLAQRVLHRLEAGARHPSGTDCWSGSDPAGRAAWACTCRTRHTKGRGRSRPRPGEADRHRRSAGRGATPSCPPTCGVPSSHARARFPCTSPPMSNAHFRIGSGLRPTELESGLRDAVPLRSSGSSTTASFMPPMAFSKRSISRREGFVSIGTENVPVIGMENVPVLRLPRRGSGATGAGQRAGSGRRRLLPVRRLPFSLRGARRPVSGRPRWHFGASTGHRIAQNRRTRAPEGYGGVG